MHTFHLFADGGAHTTATLVIEMLAQVLVSLRCIARGFELEMVAAVLSQAQLH